MFGILKKKIKDSVSQLSKLATDKAGKPEEEVTEKPIVARTKGELGEKVEKVEKKEKKEKGKKDEAKEDNEIPKLLDQEKASEEEKILKAQVKEAEETTEEESEPAEKEGKSKFSGFVKRIKEKAFSADEIDKFFDSIEIDLLQANIAIAVMEFFRKRMKELLVDKPVNRRDAGQIINDTFRQLLLETVVQEKRDIHDVIRESKSKKEPACIMFLGFNGSGKTTSIAKVAKILLKDRVKSVFAAADTFRAASIEQLEIHGNNLGINVIKHNYGSDPAAVVFDARKHAKSKGIDVVLADTAGRMHTNVNLMDELKKIVRVNDPDLKILVVDSLTGNDVVSQVRNFDEEIGIDGLILTKMDVNEKGGSIISACYTSRKPVFFIGVGQEYDDLEVFEPEKFVSGLID